MSKTVIFLEIFFEFGFGTEANWVVDFDAVESVAPTIEVAIGEFEDVFGFVCIDKMRDVDESGGVIEFGLAMLAFVALENRS